VDACLNRGPEIDKVALGRIFSSMVVTELARKGRSPSFSTFARESGILETLHASHALRDVFEMAFAELRRAHRNEYVYKATIATKILLGRHNLNTAVMLTEFRVGNCKTDVVILNGTSTAYEIKSERDGLHRLVPQVSTYLSAFAEVNVLAADSHLDEVLRLSPHQVGVFRLSARGHLSCIREPIRDTTRLAPASIFDAVRMNEAALILQRLGITVPVAPNTLLHDKLRSIFLELEPSALHAAMVQTLQETRSQINLSQLLAEVPTSLHAAVLSTRLRRTDHMRLRLALGTSVREAAEWS
jgi:hypothetical protein